MTATGSVESRPEIRLTTAVEVRQTEIAATTGTEVIIKTFKNPDAAALNYLLET